MDNQSVKYLLVIFLLLLCARSFNMPSAKAKRARAKQYYASKKEEVCTAHREYYAANAEKCKEASKLAYENKKDSYKPMILKSLKRPQRKLTPMIQGSIFKESLCQ